jgi:hypothetical protein
MRPSGAATWITEEPDEGNLHVRVCGGIGMETYLILPGERGGSASSIANAASVLDSFGSGSYGRGFTFAPPRSRVGLVFLERFPNPKP